MTLKIAEIISLALSIPTLMFAFVVVLRWGPKAWDHVTKSDGKISEVGWLIIGVTISFLGGFFDNLYWGVAWTCRFLDHPWTEWLQTRGVLSNIPFRQLAGAIAGFCHIRAAMITERRGLKILCHSAWILTLVSIIALSFFLF